MKPMEVVAILLAVALIVILAQDGFLSQAGTAEGAKKHRGKQSTQENEALAVIHQRKSVRKYTGQPVTREQLTTLVKAAMAAPTAVNKQPWAFVVVTDRDTLKTLGTAEALPYCRMAAEAAAAVVVCGDLSLALPDPVEQQFWIQDCSAATQNLLLAAESMGLGAVWTALHPIAERAEFVRKTLGLPEHIVPLNIVPIGYPTGLERPKDKFKEERIHWERW